MMYVNNVVSSSFNPRASFAVPNNFTSQQKTCYYSPPALCMSVRNCISIRQSLKHFGSLNVLWLMRLWFILSLEVGTTVLHRFNVVHLHFDYGQSSCCCGEP